MIAKSRIPHPFAEFFLRTLREALDLGPIHPLRFQFLHAPPTNSTRSFCQTFSRKASLRFLRASNSFRLMTV